MAVEVNKTEAAKVKGISIVGYLGILFLIPLLAGKDNQFAQFHANQSLVLFICSVIAGIIAYIPVIGLVGSILSLVLFVFMIIGMVNAAHLEAKPLPLIGGITLIKSY